MPIRELSSATFAGADSDRARMVEHILGPDVSDREIDEYRCLSFQSTQWPALESAIESVSGWFPLINLLWVAGTLCILSQFGVLVGTSALVGLGVARWKFRRFLIGRAFAGVARPRLERFLKTHRVSMSDFCLKLGTETRQLRKVASYLRSPYLDSDDGQSASAAINCTDTEIVEYVIHSGEERRAA